MGGSAGNEKNKWTKNEAEELNVSKINRTGKRTPRPPSGDEALEHLNSRSFSATADTSFATPRVPQAHGEAPRGGCQVEQISINKNTSMFMEPDANGDRNKENEQRPTNTK